MLDKVNFHEAMKAYVGDGLVHEDVELTLRLIAAQARDDFWSFRRLMHPEMVAGWWAETVAVELQKFYYDFVRGKRPKMAIFAPPQHGKTMAVTDFLAWVAGKNPALREMYTSYSDKLGVKVNGDLQRVMLSPQYKLVFPNTRLGEPGNFLQNGVRYQRNTELIEFISPDNTESKRGSFANTTVRGQINGLGLDLGVIDDPLKGRAEANSKVIRDGTWDWLVDDFFGRFSDLACMLLMVTRWHKDDPGGRFLSKFTDVRVCEYSAIATKDERFRKVGDALFPQHKSLPFLLERKGVMAKSSWESQYQQNPIVVGGDLFPVEKFKVIENFDHKEIVRSVRYWDKAGTQDGGAYTAGVLIHTLKNGTFVVGSVVRGQWSALKREERIKQTAQVDNANRKVSTWIEQEPGSGGKESAENTIRLLAGFTVAADKVTGDKAFRAEPYAAQVQGGNVYLLSAEWNQEFIDEHEEFPSGKYKDQVDAAAGAFNKSVGAKSKYDSSMAWV